MIGCGVALVAAAVAGFIPGLNRAAGDESGDKAGPATAGEVSVEA
ncbi:hypothetical protein [Streptomyces sp. NBC_01012]|nr:hypothetical protein OG623_15920 [Streptomyces sp. NBC_01012]